MSFRWTVNKLHEISPFEILLMYTYENSKVFKNDIVTTTKYKLIDLGYRQINIRNSSEL